VTPLKCTPPARGELIVRLAESWRPVRDGSAALAVGVRSHGELEC
jgi:hypothetical protein